MNRLRDAIALYRIYRQCMPRRAALRRAWIVSGG